MSVAKGASAKASALDRWLVRVLGGVSLLIALVYFARFLDPVTPVAGMALRVWLTFAVPGVFAAPLLRRAFPGLFDGGLSIARPAGWVLVAWVAWILPSLFLPIYGTPLVFAVLAALAGVSMRIAWTDRDAWRGILRERWGTILLGEGIAFVLFLVCVWQVRLNGDIHPLAERFMDYAILKRHEHTTSFPPMDSWMAGMTLQYYYWGYVLMDVLRRIGGMELREFFNIAICGVYGTFALALWGCGLALTKRRSTAIAALVFGAVFGNFDFVRQILGWWWRTGRWRFIGLDWFHTSRVIPGTINEVPAFSMFWGDLHPYLIAFPVVALVLCLAIHVLREDLVFERPATPRRILAPPIIAGIVGASLGLLAGGLFWMAFIGVSIGTLTYLAFAGFFRGRKLAFALVVLPLGALFPTNSWDFPTFYVIVAGAVAAPVLARLLTAAKSEWATRSWRSVIRLAHEPAVVTPIAIAMLAVLAYVPFHIGFGGQVGRGIRLATRRSDVLAFCTHFGPWLVILAAWALATSRTKAALWKRALPLPLVFLVLAGYELWAIDFVRGLVKVMTEHRGSFLFAIGQGTDHLMLRGLAFLLLVAVLWVLTDELDLDALRTPEGVGRLLFAAASGVVLVCEFAYVDDFYGGENERMNTIFKAYIQAWILLGVGSAGLLAGILAALKERSLPWRFGYAALGVALLIAGSSFALLADATRSAGRDRRGNLVPFQQTRSENLPTYDPLDLFEEKFPDDAQAVAWIEANLPPDAVIVEASAHAYEWESRFASFTGRIGLIGWQNHESGWRNSWVDAQARAKVIEAVYGGDSADKAASLLGGYGVQYLIVGELERNRAKYPAYKLEKFAAWDRMNPPGAVAIYRVPAINP